MSNNFIKHKQLPVEYKIISTVENIHKEEFEIQNVNSKENLSLSLYYISNNSDNLYNLEYLFQIYQSFSKNLHRIPLDAYLIENKLSVCFY